MTRSPPHLESRGCQVVKEVRKGSQPPRAVGFRRAFTSRPRPQGLSLGLSRAGEELCSRGSSYLTLVFLPPSSSVRLKTGPGPPGKSPEIKEENKGPGPSHGPFSGHSNSTSKGVPLIPKKPENTILCEVPWWSGKAEIAPSSCLA